MTRHLDAVSVTEHRVVLALAREFADRAELAEAAIQRVRELHTPYRIMLGSVPTDTNCNGCNRTYPCPTIRSLDGGAE